MSDETSELDIDQAETKLYELGYLLSPVVLADKLTETIDEELVAVITKAGGRVISQPPAGRQVLAYPVAITREHKRQIFTEAYFGTIRFYAEPGKIDQINTQLKARQSILRFLLIVIPAKVINQVKKAPTTRREDPRPTEEPINEEVIDQEINDLLTTNI